MTGVGEALPPDVSPLDFLRLFPEFQAASWAEWRAILARLTPDVRELYAVAGRGAGKSRMCALLATWGAVRAYRRAAGERIYCGVFGPDRRQARVTFRYVVGLLHSVPTLAAMIETEQRESVDLVNGTTVEVITASTAAPRGRSYAVAIVEEAAFLPSDDSANPDVELVRALRPALARVEGSLLAVVSSPYARRGILWTAAQRYAGKAETPGVVYVQADTAALNPRFDADAIARAYEDDPIGAATEYGATFRRDIETFVALEVVEAAVIPDRHELPPTSGIEYFAFCDPAGGSGSDSFTMAVAHKSDGERFVLDALRERRPPFSPEETVREYAALLGRYGVRAVTGDRYAGEWPREAFRKHGVEYVVSPKPKSDLYRDAMPLLNSARLELLDLPRLVAQIAGLERRTARGGRDSIDHAPGGHDDLANVALGIAAVLATQDLTPQPILLFSGASTDGRPGYFYADDERPKAVAPAPPPPTWTEEELAEVGVYRAANGAWSHSLGDDHAQRIVSGVISREAGLRSQQQRRAEVQAMERAQPARRM